jgi:hypothetical protein
LSVIAVGYEPLKYQWFKNTVIHTADDTPIPNSNSPILRIYNLTKHNEGDYYVVITNSAGVITISNTATIVIV